MIKGKHNRVARLLFVFLVLLLPSIFLISPSVSAKSQRAIVNELCTKTIQSLRDDGLPQADTLSGVTEDGTPLPNGGTPLCSGEYGDLSASERDEQVAAICENFGDYDSTANSCSEYERWKSGGGDTEKDKKKDREAAERRAGGIQGVMDTICKDLKDTGNPLGNSAVFCKERANAERKKDSLQNFCNEFGVDSSALSDKVKGACATAVEKGFIDAPDEEEAAAGDEIPCRGGPMGWIMCPLIEVVSEALQTTAGFIDSMMQFRLLSQTNSQEALRGAWQTFLNVANVLLVLAFLFIIFSQTTSAGLSNYGIKRMLPRLVLAAILMNISFYICAFAVDLSNIAGSSVMGLFASLADISEWDFTNSDGVVQAAFTDKSGTDGLGMGFVKYLSAGIAAVVIILFFLVPVLLSALLVFIVLVARQVIITILVIVAPLAFVAWLLPNTEQYFKKWWSLFGQMLFAYPMVMAVFGAAIFVATLIQGVNQINSQVDAAEIGGPGVISAIVPLVVLAIPLFLIPKIIMSTNSILAKVGGAANGFMKKAGGDALGNLAKERRQSGMQRAGMKMANNDRSGLLGAAGRRVGGAGARRRFRKSNREEDAKRAEERYVSDYAADKSGLDPRIRARAIATQEKRANEEVENAQFSLGSLIQGKPDQHVLLAQELDAAAKRGDKATAQAAQNLLIKQGSPGVGELSKLTNNSYSSEIDQALAGNLQNNHYETVETKAPEMLEYVKSNGATGSASATAKSWETVKPSSIGKLSEESMLKGIAAGGITQSQRSALQADSKLWNDLTKRQQHIIEHGRTP